MYVLAMLCTAFMYEYMYDYVYMHIMYRKYVHVTYCKILSSPIYTLHAG